MIEKLLTLLGMPPEELTKMPEADARHAMGALLVRVAKADGVYLFQEIGEIDHMLGSLYDLNPLDAAKMRAECEKLEAAMPDTEDLAQVLTETISVEDRAHVVHALWMVAEADGQRHEKEEQVVRIARQTFGLTEKEAIALRA